MREEAKIQQAIVRYFAVRYPNQRGLLFLNHNNAISAREGVNAARMGRVAGVADLTYLSPNGRAVLIEIKTPKGKQSDVQKEWQKMVETAGYAYEIVRTIDDAIALFDKYCQC